MLYIRNPLHLATMLRSILDNLHGRVNRLEKEYMVNVDMENKKFDVSPHVWSGFYAGCLEFKVNTVVYYLFNCVALSHSGSIELEYFNNKLFENFDFRNFISSSFSPSPAADSIVLFKFPNTVFFDFQTKMFPENLYCYSTKDYVFGFSDVHIKSEIV